MAVVVLCYKFSYLSRTDSGNVPSLLVFTLTYSSVRTAGIVTARGHRRRISIRDVIVRKILRARRWTQRWRRTGHTSRTGRREPFIAERIRRINICIQSPAAEESELLTLPCDSACSSSLTVVLDFRQDVAAEPLLELRAPTAVAGPTLMTVRFSLL